MLVELDYTGKDINIFMPAFGIHPDDNMILNYDKNNFVFNIRQNGRSLNSKLTANQVIENIENGFYQIQN